MLCILNKNEAAWNLHVAFVAVTVMHMKFGIETDLYQTNTCKMSNVYRSLSDSERNFAFNKSVAGHDETNWSVSDNIRAKTVPWHSCNKRGLSGADNTTEILPLHVGSIWLCQSVQQGSHKSCCLVHRTCDALSLWEWNMWGRARNAALHPHESCNMIQLFHIANNRCVSIKMATLIIQETSSAVC